MKIIRCYHGQIVEVDDADYEKVKAVRWHAHNSGNYAATTVKGKQVLMHHFIMGNPPEGHEYHHKDHDGWNNQRFNLELVSQSANGQHGNRKQSRKSQTGFYGLRRLSSGHFEARIKMGSMRYSLGTYLTAEEAAKAYDMKAVELYGPTARINFPDKLTKYLQLL